GFGTMLDDLLAAFYTLLAVAPVRAAAGGGAGSARIGGTGRGSRKEKSRRRRMTETRTREEAIVELDTEVHEAAGALGHALRERGWTIACAESCTGGMVCRALTEIGGSSDWFERGFVTYSNAAKSDLLGVSADTLKAHGAVSEQAAGEMAEGALGRSRAQLALSITGIAGPG